MSVHLTTFKTPFGNSKAENQNLILAFSVNDGNIAIVAVKRVLQKHSVVIFGLVQKIQNSIFKISKIY